MINFALIDKRFVKSKENETHKETICNEFTGAAMCFCE